MTRRDHTAEVAAETQFDTPLPIRGKRKFRIRPEDALQIACVRWLKAQPDILFVVAQPERLNAPPQRRDFLKALGILGNSGHPELLILDGRRPVPGYRTRTILCELKDGDGRLSDEQKGWAIWLEMHGYEHAVVRSLAELQAAIG